MIRALSLWQPWASLVALGVKSIETRSWATNYRGPVLIHAAKHAIMVPHLSKIGSWTFVRGNYHRGDPRATPDSMFQYAPGHGPGEGAATAQIELPRGVVVASATLTDCVPMTSWSPLHGPAATAVLCTREHFGDGASVLLRDTDGADGVPLPPTDRIDDGCLDLTPQLPFGDFSPGRWAWLLEDVKPTTERCPRCWGTGYGEPVDDYSDTFAGFPQQIAQRCPTCASGMPPFHGKAACEPVPMRGRQRLWIPKWEAA